MLINSRDKDEGTICSNKILRERAEICAGDYVGCRIELSRTAETSAEDS